MVTDSRTLHHYWSHTDHSPWSADGSLMLSQRADVGGVQEVLQGSCTSLPQDLGYVNITAGVLTSTWPDLPYDFKVLFCSWGENIKGPSHNRGNMLRQVWMCRPKCLMQTSFVLSPAGLI